MSAADVTRSRDETGTVVAAARAGDESAFSALTERYRRELQLHCYRMLGSLEDSEDAVQETFLRAWRKRAGFEGRSTFRAWLYRIATNACLDAIERRRGRPAGGGESPAPETGPPAGPAFDVPWLQPYPDRLLEGVPAPDAEPDAAVVAKETIELTFLVAIQQLPPRQRAVLIMRGVLGWSAKDTAALLETSVPSVNSSLQRARATLKQHLPGRRQEWAPGSDPSEEERALLKRYVDATERADVGAFIEIMRDDARFAMPPTPETWVGAESIVGAWQAGGFGSDDFGELRCIVTRANTQPAVACYRRRPGESEYRPLAIDVLGIADGLVAEITAFPPEVFEAFELPRKL